jgi:hypothetical protein
VIWEVTTSAELAEASLEHHALLFGDGGDDRFELVLAAGTYAGAALSLEDDPGHRGRLDVVVRGPSDGVAVLLQPRLAIEGRRVAVHDLVLRQAPVSGIALRVAATRDVTLDGVALVQMRFRAPAASGTRRHPGGIVLEAAGDRVGATLHRCAFADVAGPAAALAFRGRPGRRFGAARIEDTAFVGVTATPGIAARAVGALTFSGSVRRGAGATPFVVHDDLTTVVWPDEWGEPPEPLGDLEATVARVARGAR